MSTRRVIYHTLFFCTLTGFFSLSHFATSPLGHAVAYAAVPHLIRYQGQVADSQGVPLEGPYTLIFRLYDAPTAGTKVWEETQPNIPLTTGHFSVLLGQVTPLNADWSKPLWLSVQVGTEPELSPRQQITSVPLAMVAERLADSQTLSAANLLKNGSFEAWLADATPSDWQLKGTGAAVAKNTADVQQGRTSLALTSGTDAGAQVVQTLPVTDTENTGFRRRLFTLRARVKATAASRVRIFLDDDWTNSFSGYHSGTGAWETLTVTTMLHPAATALRAHLFIEPGPALTATCDEVALVEGPLPFAYSPHPQDALDPLHIVGGRVGIGTTSPQSQLNLLPGGTSFTVPAHGELGSGTTTRLLVHGAEPGILLSSDFGYPGGADQQTGTETRLLGLQLSHFAHNDYRNQIFFGGGSLEFVKTDPAQSGGGYTRLMAITTGGNVGIGTPSPQYKLDVEGYVQAQGYYTGDLFFQKDGQPIWRMYEDEQGLYLESLLTRKRYRLMMEETPNP